MEVFLIEFTVTKLISQCPHSLKYFVTFSSNRKLCFPTGTVMNLWLFLSTLLCMFPGFHLQSRYRSEMQLVNCLCSSPVYERLMKIQCMDYYSPPGAYYKMGQAIQYCSYLMTETNFGETMRQRVRIMNYNPWGPTTDLHTGRLCGVTKIQPNVPIAMPLRKAVTQNGWVIASCILEMARMDAHRAAFMIREQNLVNRLNNAHSDEFDCIKVEMILQRLRMGQITNTINLLRQLNLALK